MANEKTFEVGGLQFTAIRQQVPVLHWVMRIDESNEVLQAGAGGISTESVPKMQASVQELFERVSKKDMADFRKRWGLPSHELKKVAVPDFNDFNQGDRYSVPVKTRLVLSLPITDGRPETMRVTERVAANGTWFEVETFNAKRNQWIEQKTHPTEAGAIADANGWYPQKDTKIDADPIGKNLNDHKAEMSGEALPPKASAIPDYSYGQRFDFKQYDQIIGNGYRGTVVKVFNGEMSGMIEVRLPGGVGCIPASYPDCYPATYQGVEIVTDGRHIGVVEEVSQQFVMQSAGRGKHVIHEANRFDLLPNKGDILDVRYDFGKIVIVKANDRAEERQR